MKDPNEIITIERVLIYKGPRSWVEATLEKRYVKNTIIFKDETGKIIQGIWEKVLKELS